MNSELALLFIKIQTYNKIVIGVSTDKKMKLHKKPRNKLVYTLYISEFYICQKMAFQILDSVKKVGLDNWLNT